MTLPQPRPMLTKDGREVQSRDLLRHPQQPGGMIVVRIEHGDKCVVMGSNGLRKAYDAAYILKSNVVSEIPLGAPTKFNAGQHITNGYDRWIICGARYQDDNSYKEIQYSLRNHSKNNEIGWHTEEQLHGFTVEKKSNLHVWVGAWICDFVTGTVAYVVNINDRDAKTTVLVRGMHKERGLYTEIREPHQICVLNDWVDKTYDDAATRTFDSSKPNTRMRDIIEAVDNPKPKKQLTEMEVFFPKPAPDPVFHVDPPAPRQPKYGVGQKVVEMEGGRVVQVMEYRPWGDNYVVTPCGTGEEKKLMFSGAKLKPWTPDPRKKPCPDPKAVGPMRIALRK